MDAKFFEIDNRMEALRAKTASFPARILKDYRDRLDFSWIFHDNALEGVVLSYAELKAAIDQRIISDVTLIPMYEEVRNHKTAVDFVREASVSEEAARGGSRSREEALRDADARRRRPRATRTGRRTRCTGSTITRSRRPRKSTACASSASGSSRTNARLPPDHERASKAHFRVLSVFPWTKNGQGRAAADEHILLKTATCPRSSTRSSASATTRRSARERRLASLILESLKNGIETTAKFHDELQGLRVKRAS